MWWLIKIFMTGQVSRAAPVWGESCVSSVFTIIRSDLRYSGHRAPGHSLWVGQDWSARTLVQSAEEGKSQCCLQSRLWEKCEYQMSSLFIWHYHYQMFLDTGLGIQNIMSLGAGQVCAGGVGEDYAGVCQGDSGGPLAARDSQGRWTILGVTSWRLARGGGCDSRTFSVFTDIRHYLPWIRTHF